MVATLEGMCAHLNILWLKVGSTRGIKKVKG